MSIDLNQTTADASLDKLHDIIVPDAIGVFPLAEGWILLGLLFLALLFHFLWQGWSRYKANQYRREARVELKSYEQNSKENAIALLSLAKRVALVCYGRQKVAHLSDEKWWHFMETHAKVKIDKTLRDALTSLLYTKDYTLEAADYKRLKQTVKVWIDTHKECKDV